jgi:hypothetical protein
MALPELGDFIQANPPQGWWAALVTNRAPPNMIVTEIMSFSGRRLNSPLRH